MSDLDALLAGIVANPHEGLRWLVLADWLDDHGQPERAELLRLHRELLRTCCDPEAHPERAAWQTRVVELLDNGVRPCVPSKTLMLPGGVPLVANFIPPGTFLKGTQYDESQIPEITVPSGFYMGITPVTQAQWEAVMGENPSRFNSRERPVENVFWDTALEFCKEVTKLVGTRVRLPTDDEWEFACRAGTRTTYFWGDAQDAKRMTFRPDENVSLGFREERVWQGPTTEVDTFAPNPWGLFDCHGNVWEWISSWITSEGEQHLLPEEFFPAIAPEPYRILRRGGSWYDYAENAGSARRYVHDMTGTHHCGLRIAICLE